MIFVRKYRELLLFVALLTCCGMLVVRQSMVNQSRHVELREALILLHTRGYHEEANRVYLRLLDDLTGLSDREMMDDFQRTLTLVNPYEDESENPVWNYHWTVSNKLEKRAESTLKRALAIANEE